MSGLVQFVTLTNFSPGASAPSMNVTAGNYILAYLAARVNGGTIGTVTMSDSRGNSYAVAGYPFYYNNVGSALLAAKISTTGALVLTVTGYNNLSQAGNSLIVAECNASKIFALSNVDTGGYQGSQIACTSYAASPNGQILKGTISLNTGDNRWEQVCAVGVLDQFMDEILIVFAYENIGAGSPPTFTTPDGTIFATTSEGPSQPGAAVCAYKTLNYSTLALSGTPPSGTVGTPYSFTFTVSGGTTPYTFALGGSLPPGLMLNTSTGAITGTPTTPGTYKFGITVTDSSSSTLSSSECPTIVIGCGSGSRINLAFYSRS